ncbi:MAG: type II toxin-antitoxin system RelE/ParE family toxin [Alphaproteobacteria bacterium]
MELIIPPAMLKELGLIGVRDRNALIGKAETFADRPFARHPWARALKGQHNVVRIRQGDCRIDREAQTVIVDAVAHRKEIYR